MKPYVWLIVLVGACTREPPPATRSETPSEASAPSRFVPVRKPVDASLVEAPAVVRASPEASGEVGAPTPLRIARVHVQVGTAVSAGDPIVDVYAPAVLDAAATYLSAASRARAHERRARQLEAMLSEGLVERGEVFRQRAAAAELRASRLRAIAQLRSSGVDPDDAAKLIERGSMTLAAPVDGIVTDLSARVGRSYEPGGTPIAQVRGEAPARIEVQTPRPWPSASSVVFESGDGRQIALEPIPLATVVVPASGTTRSWFAPKEPMALPDGLVGTAKVSVAKDVWEVPIGSIRPEHGQALLMRRRGDKTEKVAVEVLAASGASVLVSGPLVEGDVVASSFSVDPHLAGQP